VRYLAIDLGDKRTGLAVGDDVTGIVTPLDVVEVPLDRDGGEALLAALGARVVEQFGEVEKGQRGKARGHDGAEARRGEGDPPRLTSPDTSPAGSGGGGDTGRRPVPLEAGDTGRRPVPLEAGETGQGSVPLGELVVGLPLNMDGSEGPRAKLTRAFAARLGERTGLVVHLHDERQTTDEAHRVISDWARSGARATRKKRKERRDAIAAAVILEDFLRER